MKSYTDMVTDAKSRISEISAKEALAEHAAGKSTFLDVRDIQEVNLGKIPGALHISRGTLESKIEAVVPRDARVVLYCPSGNRSALAADALRAMGYTNVVSMAGGFSGWADAGGDIDG
jgi:rhodanese-related sulfurtransferase